MYLSVVRDDSCKSIVYIGSLVELCNEGSLAVQADNTVSLFKLYRDTDLWQSSSIHSPIDELCDEPVVL